MVKKLGEQGLVEHAPYASIMLTPAGRTAALRMVRRHRLIETWLVEEFGYSWDEVHDEAEILEHALSDRLLDAIDVQLGRPGRDPHGDPIPSADGALPVAEGLLLADCAPGLRGRIVRISDRDPAVLRRLADDGIGVDAVVVAGDLPGDAEAVIWVAVTAER
jgi:DtxR family Mn-dependent transcriptional regulator